MGRVKTRFGAVAYSDRGQGIPVVLLHANLHDQHDFDAIVPELSRRFRTIAIDWPGHGESDAPDQVSAPALADALEDVIDGLELPEAFFIGNSVGGFAAARLAITHPDRVIGLVLVNAGGFFPQNVGTRAICRFWGSPRVARKLLPTFVRSYMKPRGEFDRAIADRVRERARTPEGIAVATQLWRSFSGPGHDLRDRAEELNAPTIIVWGSRDTAATLPLGWLTRRRLPNARFATLPTGHAPFASEPARFLDLVMPFLTASDARSVTSEAVTVR